MSEAQLIPVKLPNILSLQGCLSRARAWVTDLEEIQVHTGSVNTWLLHCCWPTFKIILSFDSPCTDKGVTRNELGIWYFLANYYVPYM